MACDAEHFGNFDQTLFLGCSVVSFSADMGWNEQSSQVTIELVEDDCPPPTASPKKYWDTTLTQQNWTLADPGFIGRQLYIFGLPAYFRVKDFEFTGLIQSWEEVENSSGKRYIVKLITPTSILENTKLIIGSYAGGIIPTAGKYTDFVPNNLINIYGYAEAQGILCPQWYQSAPGTYSVGDGGLDGAVFGTPAGGFGGSLINNNGMPWYMIRNLINVLVNAFPVIGQASNFSPGRLVGRGYDISTVPPLDYPDDWKDWTKGFGLLSSTAETNNDEPVMEYFVDISELPIVPDFLRFNQTEISLLDAISRICQEAGYDFYIETLPVSIGGSIDTIIKVRTVSRRSPPVYGKVDTYIAAAKEAGILRGSSVGTEYRNEINSRFIIGGQKETLYQAPQDYFIDDENTYLGVVTDEVNDVILPFFGLRDDETMIVPYMNSGFWEFEVDTTEVEGSLNFITFSGLPITIAEGELLSTVDQTQWGQWISAIKSDTDTIINNVDNILSGLGTAVDWNIRNVRKTLGDDLEYISGWNSRIQTPDGGFRQVGRPAIYHTGSDGTVFYIGAQPKIDPESKGSVLLARDAIAFGNGYLDLKDQIETLVKDDLTTIYNWVAGYADEYYGKKFAVRVPQSCVYTDEENNQLTYSEQPSQGGGWTEVTGIFGLATTGADIGFFRNDNNKIETIVAWTDHSTLDFSNHDESTYILRDSNMYLKGTVDSDYVFHDMNGIQIPRAIVSIPSPVVSGSAMNDNHYITHGFARMLSRLPRDVYYDNLSGYIWNMNEMVANKSIASLSRDSAYIPDAVAFGMKSNIDTYGPWVSIGTVGGIEIDQDQGLVPWEYNGYENLNLAGDALAEAGLTNMQASEVGNISVIGTPTIPLGAELNSLSLLTNNHLFENRGMATGNYTGTYATGATDFDHDYKYFDFGFVPSGVEGPNVTNISINIGTEVTTQYQFRTYTPKYGRFSKINADRLKEVSQNKMKVTRDLRAISRKNELTSGAANSSMNFKSSLYHEMKGALKKVNTRAMDAIGTPHELFIGQIVDWGEDRRPIIATSSINDIKHELSSGLWGYDFKSIASLDSLIRPISMQGAGGLPRLVTPLGSETGIMPTGTDGGSGSVPLTISQIDLVPYINPATYDDSQHILFRRYDTGTFGSNLGHDIDMVSRTDLDSSGNMLTPGISNGLVMSNLTSGYNEFDYKDDYRTFALRGPLLVQSWGYDTNDFPIPNQVDTLSGIMLDGVHESTGLSGSFMSGWLRRSDTWPVAPVDLRLNRELGLWQVKAVPDAGSAYVTEAITAAVYDDSPADDGPASGSKTITFGSGTMEQYSAITGSGSYDMQLNGVQETVFTIASATTPVGKHIHWMTIDNRKMMIVEPCI